MNNSKLSESKTKVYKVVWATNDLVFVVRRGTTSNKKIARDGEIINQTYTFSREQYRLANCGEKITMDDFFRADGANCLDCPFSGNVNGKAGACYTQKYQQYSGFLSMLRSIGESELTPLTDRKIQQILWFCRGKFTRFGSYGEPSLLPFELVSDMVTVSKNHTGYTHQSTKNWAQPFAAHFMASRHADLQTGWRSFSVIMDNTPLKAVSCPASEEMGFISNCSKCGLCSGTSGKGKVDVKIYDHA